MVKKELIKRFRELKHNNFDLLWDNMGDEHPNCRFFLEYHNMKHWTNKKIEATINMLLVEIKLLKERR